jgi:hypothetical protein
MYSHCHSINEKKCIESVDSEREIALKSIQENLFSIIVLFRMCVKKSIKYHTTHYAFSYYAVCNCAHY